MSDTQLATQESGQTTLSNNAGLQIQTFEEMLKFAKFVHESQFCPKGLKTEGEVFIALQATMEIGLPPMAGLQNIAVVNGRPTIYGDAALAVVRASGLLESYKEEVVGEGDDKGVKVTVKRRGYDEASESFTVKDAKTAGLWGKQGPWTQYPRRMLMFRARGFVLRDQFSDVLKGFRTTEEVRDYDENDHETRVSRARSVNDNPPTENPFRKSEADTASNKEGSEQ